MLERLANLEDSSLKSLFQRLDKSGAGFLTAEGLYEVMDESCESDIQSLVHKHGLRISCENFAAYLRDLRDPAILIDKPKDPAILKDLRDPAILKDNGETGIIAFVTKWWGLVAFVIN
jgi:hypothetical protein